MSACSAPPMTLGNAAAARVGFIVWCLITANKVEPDPARSWLTATGPNNHRPGLAQAGCVRPVRVAPGRHNQQFLRMPLLFPIVPLCPPARGASASIALAKFSNSLDHRRSCCFTSGLSAVVSSRRHRWAFSRKSSAVMAEPHHLFSAPPLWICNGRKCEFVVLRDTRDTLRARWRVPGRKPSSASCSRRTGGCQDVFHALVR